MCGLARICSSAVFHFGALEGRLAKMLRLRDDSTYDTSRSSKATSESTPLSPLATHHSGLRLSQPQA